VLYHFAQEQINTQPKEKDRWKEYAEDIRKTFLITNIRGKKELKLKTSDKNKDILNHITGKNGNLPPAESLCSTNIWQNYEYFRNKIDKNTFKTIYDNLKKLTFIKVSLKEKDSPQRIFESMNAYGIGLEQSDLIRNYILMEFPNKQNYLYNNYWKYIEENTKKVKKGKHISCTSEFIRHWLQLIYAKEINTANVFTEFKEYLRGKERKWFNSSPKAKQEHIEDFLEDLKLFAECYNKLLNPETEDNKEIKLHLGYIQKLDVTTSYPFLMTVLYDKRKNIIKEDSTIIKILEFIESFVIRRIIANFGSNSRNDIFLRLCKGMDKTNNETYIASIYSKVPALQFPTDEQIEITLKARPIYGNLNPKRLKYILERIERFDNKSETLLYEKADIEHIFPQTPNSDWEEDIPDIEERNDILHNFLHTLGNLTLISPSYNSKISNKRFSEKRDIEGGLLSCGFFFLLQGLKDITHWNKKAIEERTARLTKIFCQDIWKRPNTLKEPTKTDFKWISINDVIKLNPDDVNSPQGKKPLRINIDDNIIKVKTWRDLFSYIINELYNKYPDKFVDLSKKQLKIETKPHKYAEQLADKQLYFYNNYSTINCLKLINSILDNLQEKETILISYQTDDDEEE
jgi:hypothetical protein